MCELTTDKLPHKATCKGWLNQAVPLLKKERRINISSKTISTSGAIEIPEELSAVAVSDRQVSTIGVRIFQAIFKPKIIATMYINIVVIV